MVTRFTTVTEEEFRQMDGKATPGLQTQNPPVWLILRVHSIDPIPSIPE